VDHAGRAGWRSRRLHAGLLPGHEAVAPAGNRGDAFTAQQRMQCTHLDDQVVLDHHLARPDGIEQLFLGHQTVLVIQQGRQHIECARAQRNGALVHQDLASARSHLHVPKEIRCHGLGGECG
jgi:hypothetical protein